jgi:polysaccharide export outer membrane protein
MEMQNSSRLLSKIFLTTLIGILLSITGCSTPDLNAIDDAKHWSNLSYRIGPGDTLNVFVWGNTDLSVKVIVRPDGYVTTPLVEDVLASGLTPTELARELETKLSRYIKSPKVTVSVENFVGRFDQQIRVVGEAAQPRALPYRESMTLLDVMIAVGGITEFAAGNRSTLVRTVGSEQKQYRIRIDDLIKEGDMSANVQMLPGDVIIIPEAWF